MLLALGCFLNSVQVDTRGPIQSAGKAPIVGRQSVQAGSPVSPISPDDRGPNVGRWIWLSTPPQAPARFRKAVVLEGRPRSVRAWITAEVRYRLWVNGRLASRGPADAGRDYDSGPCGPWFEDARDLTRFFKTGPNQVALEVFGSPLVYGDASSGHPGLKVDLKIESQAGEVVIGTDASWHAEPALDLDQSGATNGFRIDLGREPAGWQTADFDDRDWSMAQVVQRDDPRTLVSELPPPMEAEIHPISFARVSEGVSPNAKTGGASFTRNGSYTLRFGHVLPAYIGLKILGHKGAKLVLTPKERDAPGTNRPAEILLREGPQVVELPYISSFSVLNIEAAGVSSPIEIEDVRCVFTSYPVRYSGAFECSDPALNRMWEVCRWVTQICMQTHHLDSPDHQEPVSDAGDYLIESLNEFYAFGDGTLTRQDLKKIGRTLVQRKFQSFHTSYSLLWLRMLVQYTDYTGDEEPGKELAPVVAGLLDRFETYLGPNGLISEAPNYMFMDWVQIEGFSGHHPPAVIGQGYMTALYYRALDDGLRVARLTHDDGRAARYEALRKRVAKSFERELWVPEAGLYRDGRPFQTSVKPNQWMPADKQIETFSTQANALAVVCGLAPADRARQVMQAVLSRKDMNCQPYFMHFVFEAIEKAGLFDRAALPQIKRWKIQPDSQSFYEMWDSGDLSHAWNATPLFQMSGRILGVEPIEPGFATFRIRPEPCGLEWAKGRVPTPHGPIDVDWERTDKELRLSFTVPLKTLADVYGKTYGPGVHKVTRMPSPEAKRS